MSDDILKRLRDLRDRADQLLKNAAPDLKAFLLDDDHLSFRRKPDSESRMGDVNVTTTCSCVMALAVTNEFHRFYHEGQQGSDDSKAQEILTCLVNAPWMSSGLTSNNAFTTALVLRTYGFLVDYQLLTSEFLQKKRWDLELNLKSTGLKSTGLSDFLKLLKPGKNKTPHFLYLSLSDNTCRLLLESFESSQSAPTGDRELIDALTADLRRIIHGNSLYSADRFPKASQDTLLRLSKNPDSYDLAEINHLLLAEAFPQVVQTPAERSFDDIAKCMAGDKNNFRINNYPPAVPVMYWFVDGVTRGKIDLDQIHWSTLCEFATTEFNHQRSLVLAEHDAMMDPVALGMAACLCARLSAIVRNKNKSAGNGVAAIPTLPSVVELLHSIKEVFKHQTKSGIWPKYFPMFHYQEAGSNFCFTFELLEAILHEFANTEDSVTIANDLLSDATILSNLEKAVTWCEHNHLETFHKGVTYRGWNSGGELKTLRKNQPESWATAVVHMFLWELSSVLSHHIQRRLLEKYKPSSKRGDPDPEVVNKILDIELTMKGERITLKRLLTEELVPANRGLTEGDLRRKQIKSPMSALLFGPPGTSKTRLTKAIAEALGWPLIVINPSEFVKDSLALVYSRADEIFRDLRDLSAVVIFFDEMDALMQNREGTSLDTETQFLTTSMLPNLTDLHDNGRIIFLMATNFQDRFDAALKRAGRFDLLLCIGPPTLSEKINNLSKFFSDKELLAPQEDKAKKVILDYTKTATWLHSQLELFTFADFKEFLKLCGTGKDIGDKLQNLKKSKFKRMVQDYSKHVTLRMDDLPLKFRKEIPDWDDLNPKERKESLKHPIGGYLRDRKESKSQY